MILGRLRDTRIDAWWSCLRCYRYFTKRPDQLVCPDCVRGEDR